MSSVHTVEYEVLSQRRNERLKHAPMWMDLGKTLLSERGQAHKISQCRIPPLGNMQDKSIPKGRKQINRCLGLEASLVAQMVKNPPAMSSLGSTPELGRSPGGGHGNPLQYSCLENPTDRGAWWVKVHRIKKSQTRLKRLSTPTGLGEIGG